MGRKRTRSPDWLPKRCYPHRKQILYYPPKGKPIPLGPLTDPGACLKKYAEIIGSRGERPRTLGDVIDKYLAEIVPITAPRSIEDYRLYCGKLKYGLGHMLPDEVEITELYDYHNARNAPIRANREITILGVIYQHAIRWRAATRNPTIGFLFHQEKARDRDVSSSERRRFAKICPPWLRGYILLKYLTGRRQGELLKLTKFSGGRDGIAFSILKKRRERVLIVRWTPRLRAVWQWVLALPRPDTSAYVFWATKGKNRGKALSKRGFKSAWQRAQAKWIQAGNEAFWEHDIRAAAGTAAEDDARAQELLDHESVSTTRRSYRRARVKKVDPLR